MDDFENYAGQSVHIERLRSEFAEGTFTHAYLFAGPVGTGKKSVARLCAMTALCRGEHRPCGVCGPCRRVLAETHPDVHVLRPAAGKREIAVGQMRDLLKEADVHTFEDGVKVFLIPEAEKMNAASQNTLLKTLEEPASNTVFLLTTVHLSALLPTVVSRCRLIRFHPLTDEETAARLRALGVPEEQVGVRARIAEGCVGQALAVEEKVITLRNEMAEQFFAVHSLADIPDIVNRYKDRKDDRQILLDLFEEIVREILLSQAGRQEPVTLPQTARNYARAVPLEGGLALRERILEARKMVQSNVAFQSVLETVLIKISEEYTRWPW
ncbi:MAG: DNA polymerase III subunit delta' [Clostridia bacterium]|nr:DNA polymerase III subunit delta' [Clostridia bacterium]